MEEEIVEKLAEIEHEQWAHWTDHFLHYAYWDMFPQQCRRWQEQIKKPYSELTEQEKEADRKWARKVLAFLHSINAVVSSEAS